MSGFYGIHQMGLTGAMNFAGGAAVGAPARVSAPIIQYESHYPDENTSQLESQYSQHDHATNLPNEVSHSDASGGVQNCHQGNGTNQTEQPEPQPGPVVDIDIVINNVVSTFNCRCHLNLKRIAMEGANVEFRRENGMVNMKLRRPYTTASIWSSGKITCTGATSEEMALVAARRFARVIQKLDFPVHFNGFRVVNVLGTCVMPFGIRITHFSRDHRENASYEPELHPGVTYKIKEPKATLKIFSTGSITVTAPSVQNVQLAIEHIYPLVAEYKMELAEDKLHLMPSKSRAAAARRRAKQQFQKNLKHPMDLEFDSEEELPSDLEEDDFDSEDSQD